MAATLDPETEAFYRHTLQLLEQAEVPVLVAGAYAFATYTGIARHTKDFDVFICQDDIDRALEALSAAGYQTEVTFPHWLAKAYHGEYFIDLIYKSGNGVSGVDRSWFDHSRPADIFGVPARLCPPEEIIWQKAFIQERERFDGADVAHLIQACAPQMDWDRLLHRFGDHWRVLFAHLVLFGFIFPSERAAIPAPIMNRLLERLRAETEATPPEGRLCQGTLLSRAQYLLDVEQRGYRDARVEPIGRMSAGDVADWTAAIDDKDRP